jgi:hypothetical protein
MVLGATVQALTMLYTRARAEWADVGRKLCRISYVIAGIRSTTQKVVAWNQSSTILVFVVFYVKFVQNPTTICVTVNAQRTDCINLI